MLDTMQTKIEKEQRHKKRAAPKKDLGKLLDQEKDRLN